jgi:hypothetical protein
MTEINKIYCGSKDRNPIALKGMNEEFLTKLGIQDKRILNREVSLTFTV